MRRALLITMVLGVACTKVESEHVLTSGMHAQMTVTADGSGSSDVWATLYLGNPINLDFVELTGDDELIASTGQFSSTMTEFEILNIVSYHADFDVDAEDAEFHVAFVRSVDDGAPDSVCSMTPPFDIITPPPATEVSRDTTDFIIDWDPAGSQDLMRWEASGDCIDLAGGSIAGDPGTLTITAGTLQKRMGDMVPDNCVVTVTIYRSREGALDPGFGEGGDIVCQQMRGMSFTSAP